MEELEGVREEMIYQQLDISYFINGEFRRHITGSFHVPRKGDDIEFDDRIYEVQNILWRLPDKRESVSVKIYLLEK